LSKSNSWWQLGGVKACPSEVTVVGALAQILAFAQQKTTAASTRGGGTSLMVAGERNHLYRTILRYKRRQSTDQMGTKARVAGHQFWKGNVA